MKYFYILISLLSRCPPIIKSNTSFWLSCLFQESSKSYASVVSKCHSSDNSQYLPSETDIGKSEVVDVSQQNTQPSDNSQYLLGETNISVSDFVDVNQQNTGTITSTSTPSSSQTPFFVVRNSLTVSTTLFSISMMKAHCWA